MKVTMDLKLEMAKKYDTGQYKLMELCKLYDVGNKDSKIYAVRNRISAIVEAPSLVPTMTAVDNLKFAAMYYGVNDYSRIPEILKEVGLENTGDKKVKNFSLGMRQRLGIGVLLLNDPQLLLLDEPLNGLDPSGIAEVRDLITSLNKKGITVLISSHILSELEKVANYYGFISHGQLLEEISAEDLAKKCERTINLKYSDLGKLESALKKIGMKKLEVTPTQIKIRDSIKPLDLLTKLAKLDITIDFIEVSEGNVEDYYLNLIEGGQKND